MKIKIPAMGARTLDLGRGERKGDLWRLKSSQKKSLRITNI